ncbi:MAG: BspA family leucine-rich repeat surface protein [Prevotella sp.]|nr:BspA family leucine-rich repeat surface protein [Prevotella sp.]
MGKKILFAVMALLVMATGKIWAEDTAEKKAYAVLHSNEDGTTYSMHFVNTTDNVNTEGSGEITVGGGSDATTTITLTYTKAWEIKDGNYCGWIFNLHDEKAQITEVVFMESFKDVKVKSCNRWFNGFTMLAEIKGIENLDTSEVTDMGDMFYNCSSLKSLDLRSFITSNVQYIHFMFGGCSKLTELDLSSFKTSNLTSMNGMFDGCTNLKILNLSEVKTAEDITKIIGKLPENSNPVIFISKNIEKPTTDKNIVAENETCEEFVIDANNLTSLNIPYSFYANKITFVRTFAAGKAQTVCLPFAVENTAEYGTFYEYSGYDSGSGNVKFKKVSATNANKPYLFIPDGEVTEIVTAGDVNATANNAEDGCFFGVYKKKVFTQEEADEGTCYGWAGGEFRRAGAGASVAACRAYIRLPRETTGGSPAPARLSVELDGGATGIEAATEKEKGTAKSGANSGTEAPAYSLQGQRVGGSYKGVVIKNGKKMIVK